MKVPLLFKTSINKSTLWSISHLISHLLPPFYSCACGFLKSTPPNYTLTDKQNSWYCILVHLHDVWLHRLKDFGYATYTEMLTVWNLSLKEKGSNAEVKKKQKNRQKHTNIITDDGCFHYFLTFVFPSQHLFCILQHLCSLQQRLT